MLSWLLRRRLMLCFFLVFIYLFFLDTVVFLGVCVCFTLAHCNDLAPVITKGARTLLFLISATVNAAGAIGTDYQRRMLL